MPLNPIIIVKIFDVRGINFMRPFLIVFGNEYVLLAIDYVPKWADIIATRTNELPNVVKYIRENILYRYSMAYAIISDQGTHFNN